jgi:hypothetical protein
MFGRLLNLLFICEKLVSGVASGGVAVRMISILST